MVNGSQDAAEFIVSRLVETDEVDDALGRYGRDAFEEIKFDQRNESVEPDDDIEAAIEKVKPLAYVVACDSAEVPGVTYYLQYTAKFTSYVQYARMFKNQEDAKEAMHYALKANGYPWRKTPKPRWMGRMYVTSYFGESLDDVADTLDRFEPDGWRLVCTENNSKTRYYYAGNYEWERWSLWRAVVYPSKEEATAAMNDYVQSQEGIAPWCYNMRVEPYYRENRRVSESLLLEDHYKNSTTQINIPENIAGHMLEWGKLNIPEEDLYFDEKGGCGREKEPHITVKYGVPMATPSEELRAIVHSFRPFSVQLGGVSLFENELFDVVKLDVISDQLHEMNRQISEAFPVESKFKDYIPHATIAYVKKGRGRALMTRDIFKDASDIPSAFVVQDIEFRGSGESDDPNRVVELLPLQVAKQLGESDEVDDVLSRMDSSPEQFVVAANIKGYGQNVFYLQNDGTWSYDFGSKHQGRSSNIRNFASEEEANIWINRYRRRQSKKAPGYVVKAWAIPLGSKVKLGDEVTDLLDRTPEPDYVFQYDGDGEDGEAGPFYFAQTDRTGNDFYGTWVREINDATLYSHEDVQDAIRCFAQAHPDRVNRFRSVLVLSENQEVDDLIDRTQEPLYYVYYAKGPLFYRGDPSSAPTWSSTKEEANTFPRAKAEEHLKFWRENYPQDAHLFQLIPEYSVRENQEADDLLGRTIDEPEFMVTYTSPKYGVSYAYREEGTRSIRWSKHKPMASAFPYKEAHKIRDRIYSEQGQFVPGATVEVVPAVHSVRENQDVKEVPDPLFTVSVHSVNDRCTYYFNANGNISRSPTSLNRSQVRRARSAAEKAYGKGQARVKPVNESKDDPFDGLGFAPDVQAFRRRGRKLRQTKRPIL